MRVLIPLVGLVGCAHAPHWSSEKVRFNGGFSDHEVLRIHKDLRGALKRLKKFGYAQGFGERVNADLLATVIVYESPVVFDEEAPVEGELKERNIMKDGVLHIMTPSHYDEHERSSMSYEDYLTYLLSKELFARLGEFPQDPHWLKEGFAVLASNQYGDEAPIYRRYSAAEVLKNSKHRDPRKVRGLMDYLTKKESLTLILERSKEDGFLQWLEGLL